MTLESTDELVKCIETSTIMSNEKLAGAVRKSGSSSAKDLAVYLIKSGLLTSWQAKFLLTGRHNLRLDNYVLTNRIARDELGDRFEARHESLDRSVILQLLPKSVSDDSELREFFVSHVGKIADIDHPNLVDVHNVDEHSGRFYVVNEFLNGVSIVESVLDSRMLVLCTNQALSGVAFAQSHGILHGQLNEERIWVLNNGNFKIVGAGLAALQRKLKGGEPPQPADDFIALAKILKSRFSILPTEDQLELSWFAQLLDDLEAGPLKAHEVAIQKTDEMIATWSVASMPVQPSPATLASPALRPWEPEDSSSTASSASGIDSQPAGSSSVNLPSNRYPTLWYKHPLAFSSAALGALVLLLGGLWIGGAFNSPGKSGKDRVAKTKEVESKGTSKSSNERKLTRGETKKFDPTTDSVHEALRRARGETAEVKEEMPVSLDKTVRLDFEPESTPEPQPEAEPKTTPTIQTTPAPQTNPEPEPKVEPEPKAEPSPERVELFGSFAERIELPNSKSKEPFLIGNLAAPTESLDLEIVSSSLCFKGGRGAFALQKVDGETWNTLLKKNSKTDEGNIVGQFKLAGQDLSFTWGPKVSVKSKANFIRNCLLVVTADQQQKTIGLRQPASIPVFSLTEGNYKQRVTVPVDFPPSSDAIKIEISKPTNWPETFLKTGPMEDLHLFDEELSELAMYFDSDPPDQYLAVIVKPTVKSRLQLLIAVNARGKETEAVELNSYVDAEELCAELQRAKGVAFDQHQQAVVIKANAPNGTKRDANAFAKSAAQNLELVNENLTIATELRDFLSNRLHGGEFPVTVYYELDGQRVIIARTAAAAN